MELNNRDLIALARRRVENGQRDGFYNRQLPAGFYFTIILELAERLENADNPS